MENNETVEDEAIASQNENFAVAGPQHLSFVNWENVHHQRCVAASLVQGVYVLERDRQKKRRCLQSYAPPWWEFFHFELTRILVDDVDSSIFGAIYALNSSAMDLSSSAESAPSYVIAFRGTIKKSATIARDLKLDVLCIRNKLQESSRFQLAMQAVQDIFCSGATNVWLTGHSLGSAIALLAGKILTRTGYSVETYLFNPPFPSVPIESIKSQKLKDGIRITGSVFKAGLSAVGKSSKKSPKDVSSLLELSCWTPHLYVNPSDKICSGYMGYFEHMKRMEGTGGGKLAMQKSIGFGKDLEPFHLIPCAYFTVNRSELRVFKKSHGIHQWWSPDDSKFECDLFRL